MALLILHYHYMTQRTFVWHEEQQNTFDRLRTTLEEAVKLNYPN